MKRLLLGSAFTAILMAWGCGPTEDAGDGVTPGKDTVVVVKPDTVVIVKPDTGKPGTDTGGTKPDTLKPDPGPKDTSVFTPGADTALCRSHLAEAAAEGWKAAESLIGTAKPGESKFRTIWTRKDTAGIRVLAHTHGLYRRAVMVAFTTSACLSLEEPNSALFGQTFPLADFPAVGIMDESGSMAAAGNTRLEGKVLMGREYLSRATDYNMRFTGNVDKAVVVTESPMWENLPMTFPEATEWIAGREADFRLAAAGKPIPRDSLRAPLRVIAGDTAVEAGTFADKRWLVLGSLRITGSARVERAEIWAESILVGGSAVVRDALLYARDRMVLEGEPDLDGQFLVRDSMTVTMRGRHTGDPVFYVHGSYDNEGYHGHLGLDSADTRGIFLVADYDLPNNLYRPSLEMLHSSRVDGMLYTNSYARIEGIVNGGLVCDTFRYEYKGTIWIGFLKDAHVTGYPAGAIFRGPPLFAGGKGTWMGAFPAAF